MDRLLIFMSAGQSTFVTAPDKLAKHQLYAAYTGTINIHLLLPFNSRCQHILTILEPSCLQEAHCLRYLSVSGPLE